MCSTWAGMGLGRYLCFSMEFWIMATSLALYTVDMVMFLMCLLTFFLPCNAWVGCF